MVIAALLLSLAGLLTIQPRSSQAHPAIPSRAHLPVLTGKTGEVLFIPGTVPPTDAQCRTSQSLGLHLACVSPQEMHVAYNITPLLNAGFTGRGQTIVIVDAIGSPTIEHDLKVFDAGYGLPDPPSFQIVAPLGTAKFDPNNLDHQAWAFETTLDVEWAHAIAPEAKIVLATSPVDETQGVQGMPELLAVEKFVLDHHMGQIFSQSWGTTENTLFFDAAGKKVLRDFEAFYERATAEHVSLLASAGDDGTSNFDVEGNTFAKPTVIFPSSSPLVTAVGGTSLKTDTDGNYQSETVWNNTPTSPKATAGGLSQFFKEPPYQRDLLPASNRQQLNGFRGLPDIAYNADAHSSAVLAFCSFLPDKPGFYLFGGTSEGVPQWAGLIAIANQMAQHPIGFLNPLLYALGNAQGYHDITVGNNGGVRGVPGFDAAPGWDLVTGWGTPNADVLVRQLVGASQLNCKEQSQSEKVCSGNDAP
jgi:subtilase family serine protease